MGTGAAAIAAAGVAALEMGGAIRERGPVGKGVGMRIASLLLAALVVLVASPAFAEVLLGRVVGVTDGDTIKVLDGERRQHRIRIQGIDTPERRQAFSEHAKQALSELVFQKDVEIHWEKRDHYGRIVGKVLVAPATCAKPPCARTVDAGLALVEQGLAWWYRQYSKEQSPEDRGRYEAAEAKARAARKGLFSDPHAQPPWDFRKAKRKKGRYAPAGG